MYKLNLEPWDYIGPMAYNDEMAEYIRNNGKELTIDNIGIDDKYPECSNEIIVLHKPTNMISTYKGYIWKDHFCIFDGFGSPPTDTPLDELLYVPADTKKIGKSKSFREQWMDDKFRELKKADSTRNIVKDLEDFYKENIEQEK